MLFQRVPDSVQLQKEDATWEEVRSPNSFLSWLPSLVLLIGAPISPFLGAWESRRFGNPDT
jgi:hypothetical protein